MGLAGAAAGGGIGALLGGPIGAGIGAGLGSLFESIFLDDDDDEGITDYPVDLTIYDDEDGRLLRLDPEVGATEPDWYLVRIWDDSKDRWVRGVEPFANEDGEFGVVAPVTGSAGEAMVYIPSGAAKVSKNGDYLIHIWALLEDDLLGASIYAVDWPSQRKFAMRRVFHPLVKLASLVVHEIPDAVGLEVAERHIRELDLDPDDTDILIEMLKVPDPSPAEKLAVDSVVRIPDLDTDQVLLGLAEIATSAGPCPSAAADVIFEASLAFGYSEDDWADLRREIGLDETRQSRTNPVADMSVSEAYQELELTIGATASEAKIAYRQLMKKYHPDVLADQPRLRDMATELSKKIEAAYRIVLQDIADRDA